MLSADRSQLLGTRRQRCATSCHSSNCWMAHSYYFPPEVAPKGSMLNDMARATALSAIEYLEYPSS
jgi:hypothetical protein